MKKLNFLFPQLFIPIVMLLFLWGILLRVPELVSGNYLFGHDQGRDYLAAYSIIVDHKFTLIGAEAGSGVAGINGIFHGPGYFYITALAYLFFRGDPIGSELFMVISGIVTLALAGYLGYKMFGKIGVIFILFFTAVSPLIVSQSRFIWSSHPVSSLIVLALYFVYCIPKRPGFFAPLAVFCAALTYHFQLGVAIPFSFAIFAAVALIYKVRDFRVYIYTVAAGLLAYSPMIAFEMRHGFTATQSALSYVLHGTGGGKPILDQTRLASHFASYFYNFTNTFTFEFGWISNSIQKIILYCTIPFVALGLFRTKLKQHRLFILFICLMTMLTFAGYMLLNNVVWDYYLTHLRFGYILLATLGVMSYGRKFSPAIVRVVGLVVIGIFILTTGLGTAFRMFVSYTVDVHDNGVFEKIIGKRAVIDTIYKDAAGEPFSVFVFMPGIYTWPYDYLFMTYGKQKYGYIPLHEKKGRAYLIIEPDTSQPWRHKGWLETVVQGGTVEWEKTLFNGLILVKKEF